MFKISLSGQMRRAAAVASFGLFGLSASSAQTPQLSPPAPLNSYHANDNGNNDVNPSLATDGEGHYVALWNSERGVFSAYSSDGGASWLSPPTPFVETYEAEGLNAVSPGTAAVNVVYAGNDVWVAHYQSYFYLTNYAFYIRSYTRFSTDGINWSEPTLVGGLISDTESDDQGTVIATTGRHISRSLDHGETWTSSTLTGLEEEVIAGGYLAYCGNGKWVHAAPTAYGNNPESIFWHESIDNGATWTGPRNLKSVLGSIYDLEARGDVIVAANYDLNYSTDGGQTWTGNVGSYVGSLHQQTISVDDAGNWVSTMYNSGLGMQILRTASLENGWSPMEFVADEPEIIDSAPMVVGSGDGVFLMIYQSQPTTVITPFPESDIKVVHSGSGGAHWSESVFVNSWHADDLPRIDDEKVQMVSGDNGVVLAAWAADTDHVMFARSDDYGATWSNTAPATPIFNAAPEEISNFQLLYAGNNRWMIWWNSVPDGPFVRFGDYVISNDNGFTWSAGQTFFGHATASNRNGTMVKANYGFGTPAQYGLARLAGGATFWEEPQYFELANFQMIAHSSGESWFAITDDQQVYVSVDDGRSWSHTAATNVPSIDSKFASSHDGTVLAMYGEEFSSGFGLVHLYATRSTNNGVTWSTRVPIADSHVFSFLRNRPWGHITYAGDDIWLASWSETDPSNRGLVVSVSRDGGETWSVPQLVISGSPESTTGIFPSIASQDGKLVVGWQATLYNEYDVYYDHGFDFDVYYSHGVLTPPTAARDWQLFE